MLSNPEGVGERTVAEAIRARGDLGRYRWVVNPHRTACILVDEFAGKVPSDTEALVTLPGVGPYTAGAVACFAFERDAAFVDTNARRILHRLFFGQDVAEPFATESELQRLAETMVPRGRGWKWGQSVMEFGVIHCTACKPLCESCPLVDHCAERPTIWAL